MRVIVSNSSCPAVSQTITRTSSPMLSIHRVFSMKSTPMVFLYSSVYVPMQYRRIMEDLPTQPLPSTTTLTSFSKSSSIMAILERDPRAEFLKCQKVVSEESQLPLEVGTSKPKLRWGCSPRTRATPARSSRSRNSTIAISTSRAGVLARRSHPRAGPRRTTRETTRPGSARRTRRTSHDARPRLRPRLLPRGSDRARHRARTREPPRPPRRLPWAGRVERPAVRCPPSRSRIAPRTRASEARGKHRTRPPRRRDPHPPHLHRGGEPRARRAPRRDAPPRRRRHGQTRATYSPRSSASTSSAASRVLTTRTIHTTSRPPCAGARRAGGTARRGWRGKGRRDDRTGEESLTTSARENRSARSTSRRWRSSARARGGPRAGPGTRSARGPRGRRRSRWTDEPPRRGSWRAPPRNSSAVSSRACGSREDSGRRPVTTCPSRS